MQRDQFRIAVNFGNEPFRVDLLEGEMFCLASREGLSPNGESVEVPPMTLAVLESPVEEVEDREVEEAETHAKRRG